jgi:hypothetical protein
MLLQVLISAGALVEGAGARWSRLLVMVLLLRRVLLVLV